jgi:hypothetical protein
MFDKHIPMSSGGMNGQMDKVGAREKTKENQGKKIGLPR